MVCVPVNRLDRKRGANNAVVFSLRHPSAAEQVYPASPPFLILEDEMTRYIPAFIDGTPGFLRNGWAGIEGHRD